MSKPFPAVTVTHLDLFSGIGGFAIAAQNCGYTTIGFCEKEPYAQQILKERFGAVLADADSGNGNGRAESRDGRAGRTAIRCPRIHPNIFTLNGADYAGVDLLTGGFPCQPFSVAGKRRGAADDRAIWPEMLRVIQEARPTWIIGENVAGIVTMELDNILSDLESLDYSAWPLVIPACAVDARHRRDRVWIVGRFNGRARRADECGNTSREEIGDRAHSSMVANSNGDGLEAGSNNGILCDEANNTRDSGHTGPGRLPQRKSAVWLTEPELGRVAHGIPHRAHRLRGLGNSICPPVAEEIIREIASLR